MLSIAYGGKQLGNELQAHRPEYCYKAQGFNIVETSDALIPGPYAELPVRRIVARHNSRIEPVTYWMTVGEVVVRPGMGRKLAQLRYGLQGVIPDGMLIRVSSLDGNAVRAFDVQQSFIREFLQSLPPSLRMLTVPEAGAITG